jgi:prepilin-type N-terminal cleavage/methylation domain-containing protein
MPPQDATPGADDRSAGFTLIELLVVMIIIGILAGIALPIFMNQRGKAVDSSMKADVRNIAAGLENNYAEAQAYVLPTQSGESSRSPPARPSPCPPTRRHVPPLATGDGGRRQLGGRGRLLHHGDEPAGQRLGRRQVQQPQRRLTTAACP